MTLPLGKRCNTCGCHKPLPCYYHDRTEDDGRSTKCIRCTRIDGDRRPGRKVKVGSVVIHSGKFCPLCYGLVPRVKGEICKGCGQSSVAD